MELGNGWWCLCEREVNITVKGTQQVNSDTTIVPHKKRKKEKTNQQCTAPISQKTSTENINIPVYKVKKKK